MSRKLVLLGVHGCHTTIGRVRVSTPRVLNRLLWRNIEHLNGERVLEWRKRYYLLGSTDGPFEVNGRSMTAATLKAARKLEIV